MAVERSKDTSVFHLQQSLRDTRQSFRHLVDPFRKSTDCERSRSRTRIREAHGNTSMSSPRLFCRVRFRQFRFISQRRNRATCMEKRIFEHTLVFSRTRREPCAQRQEHLFAGTFAVWEAFLIVQETITGEPLGSRTP